jgi:hypothetical protein
MHWEFAGMDVSCSIVGDGPSVYIAHDPQGYQGLKADARAIGLEKARVPVASIMSRGGNRTRRRRAHSVVTVHPIVTI